MGVPLKCGDGGLCMHGEHIGSNSGVAPTTAVATWGGSVVANADHSEYHMFASMFQMNASLMGGSPYGEGASWITNSDVVHAVSKTPGGPFTATDIALGPRGNVIRCGRARSVHLHLGAAHRPADCLANCTYVPGLPAQVCPVVEADEYWDAVTTHTPSVQRDPVSGMYLIYYMGTMQNRTNGNASPFAAFQQLIV